MASYNKVLLMGNLTRDPELRYTPGGTAAAKLGMACNRRYTTAQGEDREEVCFVDVEVLGKQAESCKNYLHKGNPVFVEGRLRLDTWDDKATGQKRSRLCVQAERVQFLSGPGRERGADGGEANPQPASQPQPYARPAAAARHPQTTQPDPMPAVDFSPAESGPGPEEPPPQVDDIPF